MLWPARLCLLICAAVMLQAGCSAPPTVPDRTVMLREVAQVLTRQEILATAHRTYAANYTIGAYNILLEEGYQQVDMVDGSVILGRTQFHRNPNWPDRVQEYVCWSPVASGLAVKAGNVVEVELRGRLATVVGIKYRSLAEGGCAYRTKSGETVETSPSDIKLAGNDGAESLHCAGLAGQGWSPARVAYGIEWRKPPPTGEPKAVSPQSGRTPFVPCGYRPIR